MSTKDKVLEILTENIGVAISGEKLAQTCGVSRAAIWKAVNALRENNCNIEGTTNGGYILHSPADIFSKELFTQELTAAYPELSASHIEVFKEIDSTNTYAKKVLSECGNLRNFEGQLTDAGKTFHNSIYVAESQTAGRGRLGRTFVSPAKTGIYLTVIYAPKGGITNPAKLTAFSAVAVCNVINRLYKVEPKIKWINDIYINDKKTAGILTEGSTNFETGVIESAVIGIGINIQDNPEIFGEKGSKLAGSILGNSSVGGGEQISRCKLAAQVAGETLSIFNQNPDDLIKQYKSLSCTIGKKLTVHPVIGESKNDFTATAIDIDDNAALVVEVADGSRRVLSSGEVSLHID